MDEWGLHRRPITAPWNRGGGRAWVQRTGGGRYAHYRYIPRAARPRAAAVAGAFSPLVGVASRAGRALLFLLVGVIGLGGLILSTSESARADVVEDTICPLTRTVESFVPPGDGPEGTFSNLNLAAVAAASPNPAAAGSAPKYASDVRELTTQELGVMNLYEVAGLRISQQYFTTIHRPVAMTGAVIDADDMKDKRDCSVPNWAWTQVGNGISILRNNILQGIIALKDAAFADSPLGFLYDKAGGPVSSLVTGFIFPAFTLLLVISGISLAMKAVKNVKGRQALAAVALTLGILTIVAALYGNSSAAYKTIAGSADEIIGAMTSGVSEIVLSGLNSDEVVDVCSTGPSVDGKDNVGQRVANCVLADGLSYQPWARGQYGNLVFDPRYATVDDPDNPSTLDGTASIDTAEDLGKFSYKGPEGFDKPWELRQMQLPCYVEWKGCMITRAYLLQNLGGPATVDGEAVLDLQEKCLEKAAETADSDGVKEDDTYHSTGMFGREFTIYISQCYPMLAQAKALSTTPLAYAYHGDQSMNRVNQAFVSLVGVLVVGAVLGFIFVLVLVWHARVFGLWLIGPLKLSAAAITGKSHMAKEWIWGLVYSWAARLAYGIAATLLILIVVLMFGATEIPLAMKLVWLAVVLWTFIKLLNKVQQSLQVSSGPASQGSGGGDSGSSDVGQGIKRAGEVGADTVSRTQHGVRSASMATTSTVRRRRAVSNERQLQWANRDEGIAKGTIKPGLRDTKVGRGVQKVAGAAATAAAVGSAPARGGIDGVRRKGESAAERKQIRGGGKGHDGTIYSPRPKQNPNEPRRKEGGDK